MRSIEVKRAENGISRRNSCDRELSLLQAILSRISNPRWQPIGISFLLVELYHG
jgi:hypothetical protein